jgi:hypothetical protein
MLTDKYTEVCGKLPLLTVGKCDADTMKDGHNQSVTGDGKTVDVIGNAAGEEDTFVTVSWCEQSKTTSGTNIRKFFASCRGRLVSSH